MSEDQKTFRIQFEGVSVAEAGQKVAGLREELLDVSPDINAEIVRDDPTTQDPGTILVLVLGTPALVALAGGIAKGIASYLERVGGTVEIVEIHGEKDGEKDVKKVVLTNVSGKDAARIAEAVSSTE